ncbi:MAG: relaxase [Sphingomonas sp.]
MILKANTRGNARALSRHLLNSRDNDQIEVHEVRGFLSRDLAEAMREHDGIAKTCRSKQTLFSVSLNPPQDQQVAIDVFEDAVARIEERNGLGGQPRIIIFHEKAGRRHCHAVWSRIEPETLTVKALPFYKMKCRDLAREIHLEQDWKLPRGFIDSYERPFNLDEWQRCKRTGRDLRELRLLAKESWQIAQDQDGFSRELEKRGLFLAKGDRRSWIAITAEGKPFAIAKLLDKRVAEIRAGLGEPPRDYRDVEAARGYVASVVKPKLCGLIGRADAERDATLAPLDARREAMKAQHRTERQLLDAGIAARAQAEHTDRASRLRSGLAGLWDRLRGEYQRIRAENEAQAWQSLKRDREQRAALVAAQLADRAALQGDIAAARQVHSAAILELHADLARQREARERLKEFALRESFEPARDARESRAALREAVERPLRSPARERRAPRERERDFGPEP